MLSKAKSLVKGMFKDIKVSYLIISVLGSAILAFGMYNIHSVSGVTEGGVLGLILLLDYWFNISPAVSGFILNALCYLLGIKILGRKFLIYSSVSSLSFSVFYAFFEQFDPIFPKIAEMPLLAAVAGALFVGIGAGLCVKIGGATGGDDALAMSLSKITKIEIQWIYMLSDFSVLLLSLSYIPFKRIIYSLITVILSGQIIGIIEKLDFKKVFGKKEEKSCSKAYIE